MKSVAVFCGANKGFDRIFETETRRLGHLLAARKIEVIFGGGSVGLMGVLADAVLEKGGEITGVITQYLFENREVGHPFVGKMVISRSMSSRKTQLFALSEGVITIPGGVGSMDELFEAITLAQLDEYHFPIALLNIAGFYDPLVEQFNKMIEAGFVREANRALLIVDSDMERLLEKMLAYKYGAESKWQ